VGDDGCRVLPGGHETRSLAVRQGAKIWRIPAAYGEMLRMLTETIASGHGSRPNNDVQNVTGVPPIRFADFARRAAQAWA
jgi:hypothetical protein